jgi:hypothetical protein
MIIIIKIIVVVVQDSRPASPQVQDSREEAGQLNPRHGPSIIPIFKEHVSGISRKRKTVENSKGNRLGRFEESSVDLLGNVKVGFDGGDDVSCSG